MGKNNATLMYQLSAALAGIGEGLGGFALPSGVDVRGTSKAAREAAQSGIAGEAIRKERERQEKSKGGLAGQIGSMFGPVTGIAGRAIGGGDAFNKGMIMEDTLNNFRTGVSVLGGGMGSGGMGGMAGGAAKAAGAGVRTVGGAAYNPAAAAFMGSTSGPTGLQAAHAVSQGMGGAAPLATKTVPNVNASAALADKRGGNGFYSRLFQASRELGYNNPGLYQSFMPPMFNAGHGWGTSLPDPNRGRSEMDNRRISGVSYY